MQRYVHKEVHQRVVYYIKNLGKKQIPIEYGLDKWWYTHLSFKNVNHDILFSEKRTIYIIKSSLWNIVFMSLCVLYSLYLEECNIHFKKWLPVDYGIWIIYFFGFVWITMYRFHKNKTYFQIPKMMGGMYSIWFCSNQYCFLPVIFWDML